MRQRVEELEKEVNNYRLQAQAQKQQETTTGNKHGADDGDIIMVTDSVTDGANLKPEAQVQDNENGSMATITVDTGLPGRIEKARTSQNANRRMQEDNGAGPTPAITPGPSPPPHSQISLTAAYSPPPPPCPMKQPSDRSEERNSVAQTQPQSYQPTVAQQQGSPHQSDRLRDALRSPTDLAAAAYITPDFLSEATHPRPIDSFARPYYSPPVSNLGTCPVTSYMDFSMTPLNQQGQFSPPTREWPWPGTAGGSDSNRRTAGGQNEPYGRSCL